MNAFGVSEGNEDVLCPAGSLAIFDVSGDNALTPVFEDCYFDPSIGWFDGGYVHDAHCFEYNGPDSKYQGQNVCALFAENKVSILNLDTLTAISSISYPTAGYVHQGWFSEDQTTVYVDDELDEQLRDILEANATVGESRVLTQARDQYKSCMDLDRLEEIGLAPLRELLEKFGGWPVVDGDSWSEDSFDWFVVFLNMRVCF